MAVEFTLLTLIVILSLGASIGILSKSVYVGGGASAVLLGYVAVQTRNTFVVGAWFLLLLMMSLAAGKRMADMLLGDVA